MKTAKLRAVGSFARPNDTTAYAAKDVVGPAVAAVITFPRGGSCIEKAGIIRGAKLLTDSAVITNGSFRLHLYSVAPVAIADNAAFAHKFADAPFYLGYIDFTLKAEGTGSDIGYEVLGGLALPIIAEGDDIYGVLEATAAYVPTANENFRVELLLEA